MSAINKDGSLNISMLERQVREDMAIYSKSRAEDEMKKRALHASKDYTEFQDFVSVSQLKPISGNDVSSLFNGSSGSQSTFRNRTVHGVAEIQNGIGCLDGYIDEKKKSATGKSKKNVEMTAKTKNAGSSVKSSRDTYNFLAEWRRKCSSSANDTLEFLAQLGVKEVPEVTCRQYFSTDIDSDVLGDIVGALHLSMRMAMDKSKSNDFIVAWPLGSSITLSQEQISTTFISSWLKAMTGCGRFELAVSFLTAKQELQLKEVVEFVKNSAAEKAGGDYLCRYNDLFKS